MARTAIIDQSERQKSGQAKFDKLSFWLFTAHIAIILYVAFGWLITSRPLLYFYTLLLPMIAMQWLLNGGCSIVNNIENLLRTGNWRDPGNIFEGAFFKTVLRAVGIRASQAQITTALCSLMLIFWVCAVCRMMLIVSGTS
jgi:hypothetical protein